MDEFLVLLQAKLDEAKSKSNINADIDKLQNQLDKLKVQVDLDPKASQKLADSIGKLINQKITISNVAVNQSNLSKTGQQIGQIISDSAEKAIGDVTSKVIGKGFTISPAMSKKVQSELESIVKDWTNNKGKVNSITIDTKTDFNEKTLENIEQLKSATVQYSNELGQVITKTLKYKQIGVNTFTNGETEAIKGWVESASTYKATLEATNKAANNFVAQQKKAVTDLINQVNQIYKSAIDQNASKPIKDSTNLSNLENKYNDIVAAISKMGSASEATFADERNSVNTLISDLKIVVKEYKNAETAATSMRSKDVGTIKSVKTNELDEFIAKIQNSKVPMKEMRSEIADLKTSLSGIHDTDSLTAYLNQFDIANSKFKSLKEQFAKSDSISSVIFNTSDLDKQGKIYIQKVRNTIEAIKPELESKLRNAGYSDIEIKGIEDAKGKIKSLTATVTDATGAFKQLNFERAKIQGNGKAQAGFIQTDDVKVIGNISSEISKVQNSFSNLKGKWEEQGVLVGEFKNKIERLEASLVSVGSKGELNGLKAQIQELKSEASTINRINDIQLLSNGGIKNDYLTQIAKLEGNFRALGLKQDQITEKMKNVISSFDALKTRVNQPFNESNYQEIIDLNDKLQKELAESSNEYTRLQSAAKGYVTMQQRLSKANEIQAWNQKNTAATKEVKSANDAYIASLRDLNSQMTKMQFNEIVNGFKKSENSMRLLGKLGLSLKNQMTQAMSSFSTWLSASTLVMTFISKTRNAVTELKEVNILLTEISKTNHSLTQSDLEEIGNRGFGIASKYGKGVTDYLTGVQDMSRAGYQNAEAMAEVSTAAQGAGDMTAEVANKMVIATDKAYKLGGSVEELTRILDGVNWVCDNNAVNMSELSEGMSIVGSTAASLGVDVNELTAVLGTMASTTQQSGSEVARAFKAILLNIRQVSDEEEGIDAEGLTKYENACNALGVSLKETKDGVLQTRDAMEVLKELSEEYNKLDENDLRRTDLLNSVGGKVYHVMQKCITRMNLIAGNPLEPCTTI